MCKIGKTTHCTRTALLRHHKCNGFGSWLQAMIRVTLEPCWLLSPAALLPLLVSCHTPTMRTLSAGFSPWLLFARSTACSLACRVFTRFGICNILSCFPCWSAVMPLPCQLVVLASCFACCSLACSFTCMLACLFSCLLAHSLCLLVVSGLFAVTESSIDSHVLWVQVALLAWLASMVAAICLSCASYRTKLTAGNQNNNSEFQDYTCTLLYAFPNVSFRYAQIRPRLAEKTVAQMCPRLAKKTVA